MKRTLMILMVFVLALTACSAKESRSIVGSWELIEFGPAGSTMPAVEDSEAGLTFNEDGSVSGSTGCNGAGSEYTVDGDQIEFAPFVSTLMACEDPIMEQESTFHQVLNGIATYEIDGDTLTLSRDGMVLVFTAAQAQ
ncbi:MAG TPA: META domain-containing protein [Anaerolineales bacterium]|nr:META domain-containing protein [Anaerolineales bacterium]